jgi:hypothetical protein
VIVEVIKPAKFKKNVQERLKAQKRGKQVMHQQDLIEKKGKKEKEREVIKKALLNKEAYFDTNALDKSISYVASSLLQEYRVSMDTKGSKCSSKIRMLHANGDELVLSCSKQNDKELEVTQCVVEELGIFQHIQPCVVCME